jgi:ABC-type transport system involved in cytochrome bd biosynthesis fused ATPase/permease subunit
MVLDEPWSNLDEEARELLAQVLNRSKESKTVLILTHEDLSSLEVDRIFHLEPEKGTFGPG